VDLKGTPEEVAEKLIKDEGGDEIKERELKRNDRHQVDGVAGSGLERGEASAVAQVSTPCYECQRAAPVYSWSYHLCIYKSDLFKKLLRMLNVLSGTAYHDVSCFFAWIAYPAILCIPLTSLQDRTCVFPL